MENLYSDYNKFNVTSVAPLCIGDSKCDGYSLSGFYETFQQNSQPNLKVNMTLTLPEDLAATDDIGLAWAISSEAGGIETYINWTNNNKW